MTRLRGLLLCLVLVGTGGPALGCLNDEESPTHEQEFRSQYGGRLAWLPSNGEFADHYRDRNDLLLGGGAALLAAAFILAARRPRSRA